MEDRTIAGNRWNVAREVASGWIGRNRSGAERELGAVASRRDATADTAGAWDDSGSGDGSALCVSSTDAGGLRDGYGLRLHVAGNRCRPEHSARDRRVGGFAAWLSAVAGSGGGGGGVQAWGRSWSAVLRGLERTVSGRARDCEL